jgi:CheY-like chemotaxis protein
VSDTGVGMDDETRRRVFEPFFTTKPPGEGTGLGMAMIYGLLKQHGGFVHVYSEPGQGTTVKLYFPLGRQEDAAAEAAPRERAPELRGGREVILLVEDEAPIQRAAKRVLERFGYTVLVAEDGEEALRTFQAASSQIALVLSDVMMPKLTGLDLYAKVRGLNPAVKFVFMSGYTERDLRAREAVDPSAAFLHKPWTLT